MDVLLARPEAIETLCNALQDIILANLDGPLIV
jgi:hypothetical protein